MQLSDRVVRLAPSATLAVSALARELSSAGKDIINLGIGEPDFRTPDLVSRAGIQAITEGFTHYTDEMGIAPLREAVADYFNRTYRAGANSGNVLIGNGAKQCLFNTFMALLNPGDEVLMPVPCWVSYPAMIEIAGGVPVAVPAPAVKNFKVTVEDLERFYSKKTRLCIINTPSNPTGAVYSREELDAIAEWVVQKNIILISDEIYEHLVYGGKSRSSICNWWSKHPENFIIINGVSKTFAMTGWRVGYLVAHPVLVKAAGKISGQSTSSVCSIAQKAAVAALTNNLPEVQTMKNAFARRRALVAAAVAAWPNVYCPAPDGAFYVFPDMHSLYGEAMPGSTALCKLLLEKAGVAVVPGVAFGDDNCMRISYATDDALLKKGLDRIAEALF